MTSTHPLVGSVPTTVPDAFRAAVARFGPRPALEAEGTTLTYAELDSLSNRLAHGLLQRGGAEPVAMVAPAEAVSVIVMLGVLKAGRPFAPIDPRDPPERVRLICEQLGALFVSTSDALETLSGERDDDPSLTLDPFQPSLVNFTSGSTGRPKGIVKSHQQVSWAPIACRIERDDRVSITLPLSFGVAIGPVLGTLLAGACGFTFDPITRGLAATGEWIADVGVTVHMSAPSAVAATAAALEAQGRQAPSVRLVSLGGERCEREHAEAAQVVFPNAVVRSIYGSTEAGFIGTSSLEPGERPKDALTVFDPFPWQSIDVVSESGDPLPEGEVGEIVVRGNDIALGYWEEPEEGEQRFLPEAGGVRSVGTGDRGRLLPDGRFEHLGRLDLRVKAHGQMVDLQAVEHALAELPAVREAVVSAVAGPRGNRLVAHVLPATPGPLSPAELRAGLADKLPSFMIPSAFLAVEAFTKNLWGKIDREGLRQAAADATPETEYSPPRDPREQALAELVGQALDLERVGREDDLFELGLDSFAMTELLVAVEDRLGVELTPRDLLRAPTIAALAPRIDAPRTGDDVICQLHLGGSGTPFFCVPGADYAVQWLRPLASRLDRPVYSFVARGFERRALPDRSVERAAARFVRALRGVQPAGPYLIGGYSFGGFVALEMAHQLRSAGESVALLTLLDPRSPPTELRTRLRLFAEGPPESRKRAGSVAARLVRQLGVSLRLRARAATAGIIRRPLLRQYQAFYDLSTRQGRRYRPKPYDGRSILLRIHGGSPAHLADIAPVLVGDLHVIEVPGDHGSMMHVPHVDSLAPQLDEALSAADRDTQR